MFKNAVRSLAILTAGIAALAALAAPAHADNISGVNSLTAADQSLLASSQPKTVVLDVVTGEVKSVASGLPVVPLAVTVGNICSNTTHACYYSGRTPYADHNFYGDTGTANGTWQYRRGGWSGGYYAKFCWNTSTCGPRLAPNTVFSFGSGVLATGKSVTLS